MLPRNRNRNRNEKTISVSREGQAKSATDIVIINIILTIKKKQSAIHNQSVPYSDLVGKSVSDLFSVMINLTSGFTTLNLESGSERPDDFYKSVEIKCHDQ
jgi:hypothetical protein